MAASTQISVEEYLRTVYRPDCDYVDGAIEERTLGEHEHGLVQLRIGSFFLVRYPKSDLLPATEVRIRLRSGKYRIPDVLVTRGKPGEQILTEPPLLCVEVLSPEDRPSRVNVRIQEYLDFGVPVVWLVDPAEKTIWIYRPNGMQQATGDSITLDGTAIQIPFAEIFG